MIYKWNEIDLDMFLEVFDSFWNGEDWTKDLVLEVQNIPAILANYSDSRVYFGKKISVNDFKEDNKSIINFLESAKGIITDDDLEHTTRLSMCILDGRQARITPVSINSYDLIRSCFGLYLKDGGNLFNYMSQLMSLWYIKVNEKKYVDTRKNSPKKYTDKEKLVRMRTMDFKDWMQLVSNYKSSGILNKTDEDFKVGDFEIIDNNSPSIIPSNP